MKTDIVVTAEPRSTRGKNEARRLRARGMAPAVVYGAQSEASAVAVSPKDIAKILRTGQNTIFDLSLDGATTPVMVVDWQNDPVKDKLLHVDLKRIDLSKHIHVTVPVHTVGEARGVKIQGGLLEIVTRSVEIDCLPEDIPEGYTVDVADLGLGQSIRASDLPVQGSVKLLSPPEQVIVHVVSLKAEETTAEGAAGTVEPEVIKKGKKEEEAAEDKGKKK